MPLSRYKKKRDFESTPEPSGTKTRPIGRTSRKLTFVIHEHHATQLHFDFRLEMDGVLKSWAVPKGPSLDPADKHLAMQVEDHPLEYGKFHGSIPEGNYGAGEVRIWDHGTYESAVNQSLLTQLREGNLKVVLHGKKLKGEFHLIRTHYGSNERAWLLFKHKDKYAEPGWKLEPLLHYGSRTQNPKTKNTVKSAIPAHKKVTRKKTSV